MYHQCPSRLVSFYTNSHTLLGIPADLVPIYIGARYILVPAQLSRWEAQDPPGSRFANRCHHAWSVFLSVFRIKPFPRIKDIVRVENLFDATLQFHIGLAELPR